MGEDARFPVLKVDFKKDSWPMSQVFQIPILIFNNHYFASRS